MAYYVFNSYTASNGVVLKVIKTSPRNVTPDNIDSNVAKCNATVAINGGFFDTDNLPRPFGICSIAAVNGKEIGPKEYESGYRNLYENGEIARGTLAWDGTNRQYYLAVVTDLSDFGFTAYSSSNWIQGGISMNLQNDSSWRSQAVNTEKMYNPDGKVTRSGLLYGASLNLYLITTPTACTAAAFRAAIKEKVEPSNTLEGIFLDGAGVPQMKCPEYTTTSETRVMPTILRVSHNVDL